MSKIVDNYLRNWIFYVFIRKADHSTYFVLMECFQSNNTTASPNTNNVQTSRWIIMQLLLFKWTVRSYNHAHTDITYPSKNCQ